MIPVDPSSVRQLVEAVIAGLSVLCGAMAYLSGSYAAQSFSAGESPALLAQRVNEGIARGFTAARSGSIVAGIIIALT